MKRVFSLLILISMNQIFIAQSVLAETHSPTLIMGVVPQFNVREIERIWKPILEEISDRAGVKLELRPAFNIPAFEKHFESGDYDFAYMNPYHALVAKKKQGYKPILRDVKKQLKGIIVVHKDNPIKKLKQLDGKKVAMPAPNALGASLLPRAELATIHKVKPVISYVGSHDSVYLNVALHQVEAGGGVMASFNKQSQEVRDNLRILYKTQGVSAHPIVAHPRLKASLIRRVQAAFLALAKTAEGQKMVTRIPMKKIGKASLKDYAPLKKLGLSRFYVK